MNWIFVFFSLIALSFNCLASENDPQSYAYGYEVSFEKGHSSYQVEIPRDLYSSVVQSELSDVQVFNSKYESVPFKIESDKSTEVTYEPSPIAVKFFPVRASSKEKAGELKIQKDASGTIIKVGVENSSEATKKEPISGYIFDLTKLYQPISSIKFVLSEETKEKVFDQIIIEASTDLIKWKVLNSNGVLANLDFNGEKLSQDIIDVPNGEYRYVRFTWQTLQINDLVKSVSAVPATRIETIEPKLNWEVLKGEFDLENKKNFHFESIGYFPVTKLRVEFADENSYAKFRIYGRNRIEEKWKNVTFERFYSLLRDGKKVQRLEKKIPLVRYKYWRLELLSDASAMGAGVPVLKLGWPVERIKFLARGEPPFYLAFGSATSKRSKLSLLNVDSLGGKPKDASIGKKIEFGGAEKLVVIEKPTKDWQKWVLWGVLVFGVLVLFNIARTLMGSLKNESQ